VFRGATPGGGSRIAAVKVEMRVSPRKAGPSDRKIGVELRALIDQYVAGGPRIYIPAEVARLLSAG